jgi:delta14-sterol reductase
MPKAKDILYLGACGVLPLLTWYATIAARHYDGALVIPDAAFWAHVQPPSVAAVGLYLAWFALQAALLRFVPGRVVKGEPDADGRRLEYTLNGLRALGLTLALVGGLVLGGVLPATILHDELDALVTTTNLVVVGLCVFMYRIGRAQAEGDERQRGLGEAFFLGATKNPRSGTFDWKFFGESRPGMILWLLLDLSFAAAQHAQHGFVSNAMMLVCLFQILYIVDFFVVEEAFLSTWDIRHEPFGFMLCWGSLVWVPFTFSLQALWLVAHPVELPLAAVVGLVLLNCTGYFIFRSSNLQKHEFRRDPTKKIWGRTPEWIETSRGTKLLVSGWWGMSRHANYLGDLMMGLAWCLCCGASRVLTFFYFIYFFILLVHRERRDHAHCARKYGADWEAYCQRVRFRILPGVY